MSEIPFYISSQIKHLWAWSHRRKPENRECEHMESYVAYEAKVWRCSEHSSVDAELGKRRGGFWSFFSKANLGKKWSSESPEPAPAGTSCVCAQGFLTSSGSPQVLVQCTDQPSLDTGSVCSSCVFGTKSFCVLSQLCEAAQAVRCVRPAAEW